MFFISIQQDDMMQALDILKETVGNNSQGVGDDCISMETNDTATILKMYTTNSTEFTYVEVNVSTANPSEKAPYVNFTRLRNIISTIPSGNMIKIEATGVNELHISTSAFSLGKKGIVLSGNTSGFLPLPNVSGIQPYEYILSVSDFNHAVAGANSIIVQSESTPIYNCMNVGIDVGKVTYLALNQAGGQIFVHKNAEHTTVQRTAPLLINPKNIAKLLPVLNAGSDIVIRDYNGKFITIERAANKASNLSPYAFTYYSSVYTGTFPTQIATQVAPHQPITVSNVENIIEVLKRAKAIYDKSNAVANGIQISTNAQKMNFRMTSGYGEIDEDISIINPNGYRVNGTYNPETLLKLLANIAKRQIAEVRLSNMTGNHSYIVIEPVWPGSTTAWTPEKFVVAGIAGKTTAAGGNP